MVFILLFLVLIGLKTTASHSIGVCYGRVADNLAPPNEVIKMYHSFGIERMRIYDHDPSVITALRGSNIELLIGVPNNEIQTLASDPEAATDWVQQNIKYYIPDVKFKYIVVGNEINPTVDPASLYVLQAMQNINKALASFNLSQIKVSTAISLALLQNSYPPSNGEFSTSSRNYIVPIVGFLVNNGAPLLANVYTYFSYINDQKDINISYALLESPSGTVVQDVEYVYKNLFEASLGAVYAALKKVSAPNLEVVVSESGWPSNGGIAANVDYAQTYYQNLIDFVKCGTQERPNKSLETYLFALFDENLKGPAESEKHFGLFTPNKVPKYQILWNRPSNCPTQIQSPPPSPQKPSQTPPQTQPPKPSWNFSSSSQLARGGILFFSLFFSSLVFSFFW